MIKTYLRLTLLLLSLCASTTLSARIISESEARARVLAAMQTGGPSRLPVAPGTAELLQLSGKGQSQEGVPTFYAFDCQGGGYVITSADDQGPAILARIPSGQYDSETLPPAMKAWLAEAVTVKGTTSTERATIEPLLGEIVWSQDHPFNNKCPHYYYQGYNYPTYAGCAAIAIAQIMRYHQWPLQGEGQVEYETDTYSLPVSEDLSQHTYDWSHILPNYIYTSYGQTEADAVATLVNDVACAIKTDFSPSASSTQDFRVAQALKRNFGYDLGLQLIDHGNYTTTEWSDVIYAELDAQRPVYLSGCNDNGGHAFVVDGYKGDGLFHINWGWNGTANGDYYLTELKPKNQGTGGNGGGYAFMQNAIIGIQKDMGNPEAPAALALRYEQIWLQHDADGDGVYAEVFNPTATDFQGLMGLRIREGETILTAPEVAALKTTCKAGFGGMRAWGIDLQSLGGKEGLIFEIVYQCDGEDEWHVAHGRTGSPRSLITYTNAQGQLELGTPNDDLFQLRLVSLEALDGLKPNTKATLRATVRNESDYEYFAPLYLFVQDLNGNLKQYSSYDLHLVPAHGEATYDLQCLMPSAGDYLFSIAYEYLGYNYDYTPMGLSDNPSQKGISMHVGDHGDHGSTVELNSVGSIRTNATTDMHTGETLVLDIDLVNKGGEGDVKVFYQIVNPWRWSDVFVQGEPTTINLKAGDNYTYHVEASLADLAIRDYEIIVQWQRSDMVLPRNAGYAEFAITHDAPSGLTPAQTITTTPLYDLTGRRVKTMTHGIYVKDGKKLAR